MLKVLQDHFDFPKSDIGIVIPVFNEESNLNTLFQNLRETLSEVSFQVLFIDDGSTDESWQTIDNVNVIRLKQNVGQMQSILFGVLSLNTEWLAIMDGDGQNPPDVLLQLIAMRKQDAVIVGVKIDNINSTLRRAITEVFYSLMSWIAGTTVLRNTGEFRIFHRKILQPLLPQLSTSAILRFIFPKYGIPEIALPYELPRRMSGKSKYSLYKRLRVVTDSIFQMYSRPRILIILVLSFFGIVFLFHFIGLVYLSAEINLLSSLLISSVSVSAVICFLLFQSFLKSYFGIVKTNKQVIELGLELVKESTVEVNNESRR